MGKRGESMRKKRLTIEFAGLRDKGIYEYGRIILEEGKLRVEGDRFLKRLLENKVRDLRPGGDQAWVDSKENPELFLKILPYFYSGTYLCASRINEKRKENE